MSHDIETHTLADGTVIAAAAFAREPAWHRLGTVFDGDLTPEQVLVEGHLGGWNVRKETVQSLGVDVPGKFAIWRDNPFTKDPEIIGASAGTGAVVGSVFTAIQNEDTLDLLAALADEAKGRFETAGSLAGGRRAFVSMRLPDSMLIGGVDPVDRYLTVLNPHDGTGALTLLDTPIRVVCANTESAALGNHRSAVKIWHTESANKSIAEIRAALDITFKYDEALEAEFERMINAPLTEANFVESIRHLWNVPSENAPVRTVNNWSKREGELINLFTQSPTNAAIRGTRWAGYNAVTEYIDWFTPVGAKRDGDKVRAERTAMPDSKASSVKELAFAEFAVTATEYLAPVN